MHNMHAVNIVMNTITRWPALPELSQLQLSSTPNWIVSMVPGEACLKYYTISSSFVFQLLFTQFEYVSTKVMVESVNWPTCVKNGFSW